MFLPGGNVNGPAASTSSVMAVTAGATNSGTDVESFSPDAVAKRAAVAKAAQDEIETGFSDLRKAADKSKDSSKRGGWSLDLNSREFLKGERSIDFGSDRTPAAK